MTPGFQLGIYRIEEQLGEGGMGVVYRALDTKLNRPVAVKFLSDDLADSSARRRFQREAQMASSLNHPHIVTVYDAGEFEGRQYLVTEFVDGGTLKTWALAEKRGWQQIVELLVGVADGLAAAHQAGILHRDIKPENILVAKNGYAKLGDFGLAKLTETAQDDAKTLTEGHTRQGVIVGSIPYMSPEQAAGKFVDTRSDIFSFGSVLFELLAGRRPFEAETGLELLQAIIHRPAPSLSDLRPDLPAGLRIVVEKALEKDSAERYQTTREMVIDLRRLTRQSGATGVETTAAGRAPGWKWASVLVALALAAVTAFVLLRPQPSGPPAATEYTQLTNFADSATSPALSPDGRMLTFVRGESTFFGPGQIYVKLLPNGEPVQLTNDDNPKMSPKFSPDGSRIGYSTGIGSATGAAPTDPTPDTWTVPVLGGQPRRLLANASGLTWFADSAKQPRVLFSELTGRGFQMSIVSSMESRADQRNVYLPPETGMAHRSYMSPDRNWVLVIEMNAGSWLPCRLLPFDGSSEGKPVGPAPAQCTDAAWSPDGKWMYFSTNTGNGVHTWRQRFPDGTPEQVTFGVTEEEGIHFAPDGTSFVTSIGTSQSTVWVHDPRGERQITSEGYSFSPSISADAKKLYYLVKTGGTMSFIAGGLWETDLDSRARQRLLPDFQMQNYSISEDGNRVVFVAVDEQGRTAVWLASLNGRIAPRQLTTMVSQTAYFGTPGEVIFAAEENSKEFLYRIREDGKELQKLSATSMTIPFGVSPDGRWIPAQDSKAWGSLFLFPTAEGSPQLVCGNCSPPRGTDPIPPHMAWTPDRRFVYLKFASSTYAIPLKPGRILPPIPTSGFPSKEAVAAVPGARLIAEGESVYPGPDPSIYAFTKIATQRNIYRVPVR